MAVQTSELLNRDGVQIFRRKWAPLVDVRPKGVLHILHGIAEHSGRQGYDDLGTYLAEDGFVVFANDHQAHGKTKEAVEGAQFGHHKDGLQIMIDDAVWLVELEKQEYPERPFLLFGHSMGSLLAAYVASKTHVDGLALCGAPNPLGVKLKVYGCLLHTLKTMYGDAHFSSVPKKLAFDDWDSMFPGDKADRWISSDENAVDLQNADPSCGFVASLKIYCDLLDLQSVAFLSEKHWKNCVTRTNVWLLTGDQDPCAGFHGISSNHLAQLIENACGRRPTITIYGNAARHEVLNEVKEIREQVKRDVLSWATTATQMCSKL